jgi:hypothetical protein
LDRRRRMKKMLAGLLIVAAGLFLSASTVLSQLPCPADFDCDGDVDAEDTSTFMDDFGRSVFCGAGFLCISCTNETPCPADFDCNGNVDAIDVVMFLEDFGRSQYNNPCPACEVGDWCVYP